MSWKLLKTAQPEIKQERRSFTLSRNNAPGKRGVFIARGGASAATLWTAPVAVQPVFRRCRRQCPAPILVCRSPHPARRSLGHAAPGRCRIPPDGWVFRTAV